MTIKMGGMRQFVILALTACIAEEPTQGQDQKNIEQRIPDLAPQVTFLEVKDLLRGSEQEFTCGELMTRYSAYHPSIGTVIFSGLAMKEWSDELPKETQQQILELARSHNVEFSKKLREVYDKAFKAKVPATREVTLSEFRKARDDYDHLQEEFTDQITDLLDPDQSDRLAGAFMKMCETLCLCNPLVAKTLDLTKKQREVMTERYNDYVRAMTHLAPPDKLPKYQNGKEFVEAMNPMREVVGRVYT